ncbi:uncharacterized protein LACBIDRAFT_316219 [Laccaria bicolor S238N-H82]|uniref:Predicted protein n=1 Tax=Laccaria bicolor (strain S238N-H82 / ATCC MYA-4686) TaxID=486041 RepID=B0E0G6_LACBS|nr:uncharacterized protein LACBIDRAFT_316219 [Laccaria bicolor S238N-H82]EDQ99684.1 predicted protein [Laccaria bicolor S238N-H82]|eukprot:XP_001889661.1 predicted protein [Laccaria bicolor S238N-H82]
MFDEMRGLINAWPVMPSSTQYPPGMPSATPQTPFVSPSTATFNHQTNGFQSAAINHGPAMYPLQNSSLMNATSAGVGLPIPIEPSAVVPDISRKLGAKAWKQVVRDWEFPDPGRKHFTVLKNWKHEWHASSRQSQLWGQRRTIALEFILEFGQDEDLFKHAYPEHESGITALLQAIRAKGQAEGKILTHKRGKVD